jgi:hypothetical protein
VPEAGVRIDEILTIAAPLRILGRKRPIVIGPRGGLRIELPEAEQLVVSDVVLFWDRGEAVRPSAPALCLLSGHIRLEDSQVYSNVKRTSEDYALQQELARNSPASWLIKAGEGTQATRHRIELVGNTFTNVWWYGCGLLSFETPTRYAQARVENNVIENHHGGVYLVRGEDARIQGNILRRVSFGNLVVGGSRVTVSRNQLIAPGNGTAGDGITVDAIEDSLIERNVIVRGSCYGISFKSTAKRVVVRNNLIAGGVTTAIHIRALEKGVPRSEDLRVEENILLGNRGWGLAALGVDGLTVRGNVFQDNKPGRDAQHYFQDVEQLTWEDNVTADGFTAAEAIVPRMFGTNLAPYEQTPRRGKAPGPVR